MEEILGKKLTIVVTCTARKSMHPATCLHVRSLGESDGTSRAQLWAKHMSAAPEGLPLMDLYQGEAWVQSRRMTDVARESGFDVQLFVASAGVGLQPAVARFPAYAATFSPGHLDTVGVDVAERKTWWADVNGLLKGRSLRHLRGPAIVVLSDAYSRVLECDLDRLADRNHEVTVFGAHREFRAAATFLPDKALRSALEGTVSSLNQRMATQWLSLLPKNGKLGSEQHALRWREWVAAERHPEVYNRKRMDDQSVMEWIRRARTSTPRLSASAALSRLRFEGLACEQKRFKAIFERTVTAS